MVNYAPPDFKYPSTRYSGSKRRLLDWIWAHVQDIHFESVLDVFGGTGSVSLLFKRYGKRVLYNDLLKSNQVIGTAIVENSNVRVTEEDLEAVLRTQRRGYPDFVQREFKGKFFLDAENVWLDRVITNIMSVKDRYKRAILMASLFQACLVKRPFNLFHRANLYIRTAKVKRTFGNKTTWERSFPDLLEKYVLEYNAAVFSNGKKNCVIGGYDALTVPNSADLVYLDPPYFASYGSQGTNYLAFYHFLEGLADYKHWAERINGTDAKTKKMPDSKEIQEFIKRSEIRASFKSLLEHFQASIIVLSYQDEGIPSRQEILTMMQDLGKKVRVYKRPHRYALSHRTNVELLFVAT